MQVNWIPVEEMCWEMQFLRKNMMQVCHYFKGTFDSWFFIEPNFRILLPLALYYPNLPASHYSQAVKTKLKPRSRRICLVKFGLHFSGRHGGKWETYAPYFSSMAPSQIMCYHHSPVCSCSPVLCVLSSSNSAEVRWEAECTGRQAAFTGTGSQTAPQLKGQASCMI